MTDRSVRRASRRLSYAVTLALAPVAALAYIGCGDDDAPGGPRVNLDPGGTWGAEVNVTVVGRGRVYTSVPGVDCPTGSCFAKYVFPSNTADGATGGVQLTAAPTLGVAFRGWTFEPVELGARGRGPEACNPVKRAATVPTVSTSDLQITLPFGEADGTSPAGQEANCGAFKKVPLAYKVTATFDPELPPFDAGFDAGADQTLYEAPDPVATNARGIGITSNGRLYWAYDNGSGSSIAYGSSPNTSIAPSTAQKVATVTTLGSFRVHPYGVVYTDGSDVYAIRTSSPTLPTLVGNLGAVGQCRGFAIDSSSGVYCRTSTSIVRWQLVGASYGQPVTLYGAGLPSGNEIAIDSSAGPVWIDDAGAGIVSLPITDVDGGAAPIPTPIVSARAGIGNLRVNSFGFAWTENSVGVFTTSSRVGPATVNPSSASTGSVLTLAIDTGNSSSWIADGTNGIYLAPTSGAATAFRTGNLFTGAAATSSYVFWTLATDGAVHRATRF